MARTYAEPAFDILLTITSVFGFGSYMLGVFIDPIPRAVVSAVVVAAGALSFVPERRRIVGGLTGLIAVLLAGVVIPHTVPSPSKMFLAPILGGLVLIATFTSLRITAFADPLPK